MSNIEAFSGPKGALTPLNQSQGFPLIRGQRKPTVSMFGCRMRNYVAVLLALSYATCLTAKEIVAPQSGDVVFQTDFDTPQEHAAMQTGHWNVDSKGRKDSGSLELDEVCVQAVMKRIKRSFVWIAVLLLAPASTSADEEGFTSLFDGKTMNGWTINCLPKDRQQAVTAWTVDQGTLLANTMGHKDHFYIMPSTNKEYSDFVLRLRFQVERGTSGNSGIQIRSRYNSETGWMEGPQIDISPPNPELTGKLWNEGPGPHRWLSNESIQGLKFFYADEGDGWNELEISAQGMRIRSVLNGVTVVDYNGSGVLDDELHKNHNVGTKGVIGLQIHSFHELKLRFKDVRIKPL